jgi:hypothetical protein
MLVEVDAERDAAEAATLVMLDVQLPEMVSVPAARSIAVIVARPVRRPSKVDVAPDAMLLYCEARTTMPTAKLVISLMVARVTVALPVFDPELICPRMPVPLRNMLIARLRIA